MHYGPFYKRRALLERMVGRLQQQGYYHRSTKNDGKT